MSRMLFLHGFMGGVDYPGGSKDVIVDMNMTDEFVAFNAPFALNDGGFKWFTLPEENIKADMGAELKQSVEYILEKINGLDIDILVGNSQGGFMALYLTLNNIIKPKRTIAVVPFYVHELINENINKDTPILWMAAGRDEVIPPNVGILWRDLQSAGANLDFRVDLDSAHRSDTWTDNFKNSIIKWNIKNAE